MCRKQEGGVYAIWDMTGCDLGQLYPPKLDEAFLVSPIGEMFGKIGPAVSFPPLYPYLSKVTEAKQIPT